MKTAAVIVARMQAATLTGGHIKLIEQAGDENQYVLVLLGTTPTRLTHNNPLHFEERKHMLLELFDKINTYKDTVFTVLPIYDQKNNAVWDKNFHEIIEKQFPANEFSVMLYHGRNSFLEVDYMGPHKTRCVDFGMNEICGTNHRAELHKSIIPTPHWRAGVIYASNHRYPVSYQVVDIAVINYDTNEVLLIKKQGEDKYRFPGGFVDPEDESLELAAKREVMEECGGIETDDYRYVGSARIDDWRYRNEKDKIMTAFFICKYMWGRATGTDDAAEAMWIHALDLTKSVIEPEHHVLVDKLTRYLIKEG